MSSFSLLVPRTPTSCSDSLESGRYSLPRDAPPAHVARDALLDDGRHPKYEFWAPNPYYTNYIRHDGAHFKEDFQRNLGMSLDFLYHAWFQFVSLLSSCLSLPGSLVHRRAAAKEREEGGQRNHSTTSPSHLYSFNFFRCD